MSVDNSDFLDPDSWLHGVGWDEDEDEEGGD